MRNLLAVLFTVLFLSGCYSFRGVSIAAEVNTFYLPAVKLTDFTAPPDSPERFMEQFREKIRSQSDLKWNEVNPDIEFDCNIISYRVSNEGSRSGNEVSLNKLTISVKVDYTDNTNEEENWSKTFSFGIPFNADEDLQELQDGFIEDIFEQITENIFNDAFTNW